MSAFAQIVPRGMSYARVRMLTLLAGTIAILAVATAMYARNVETEEVIAILFFIPIFFSFVYFNAIGGIVAGAIVSAAYVGLRWNAIDAVGFGTFAGLVAYRTVAYIAFGAVGGWAMWQLGASLNKLDIVDHIDDATGLYNARFLLQDIDLETSRSQRYSTIFSVTLVDIPANGFDELGRRKRERALKDLGRTLRDS